MTGFRFMLQYLAAGALALAACSATADTALNGSESVTLGPGGVNGEFYVDVPEGATHLVVQIESANHQQEDVDLLLRYGEPFDPPPGPTQQSLSRLIQQSLYYAIGDTGHESIEVTFASSPPVSPGRWYLAVVNPRETRTSDVTVAAEVRSEDEPDLNQLDIQVAYTDEEGEGFLDETPFTPIGGNDATRLGEARRNAFEEAIRILEESFTSPVPIVIAAGFNQKRGEDDEEVCPDALACAGPTSIAYNFPGAQVADTWYPRTTIPRLTGTDYCRLGFESCKDPRADIFVSFSTEEDLGDQDGWWYGLERNPAFFRGRDYDFIAVAMHEMLHGLGFLSFTNVETGAKQEDSEGNARDDIYTEQLRWHKNGNLFFVNHLSDEQRTKAFTAGAELVWGGEFGRAWWDEARISGDIVSQDPLPSIFAPEDVQPGSSVSHVIFTDLMNPTAHVPTGNTNVEIRESGPGLGAAWAFLRDAGWDAEPKPKLGDPPAAEPPRGMWYDRARDGHGFDFQRVGDQWFLVFYTYDDAGNPEWYLSLGTLEDGVFTGELERFTYDGNDPDGNGIPQEGEPVGTVALDLNATSASPACDDGVDRGNAGTLPGISCEIGDESGEWCAEPLPFGDRAPDPDFTGHWFAGEDDQGWGMTIQVRDRDDGSQILVNTLYFYDDQGNPRWAQGVTPDFINSHDGQAIDMRQFDGYARSSDCTPDPCTLGDNGGSFAGPLQLRLEKPLQSDDAGSRATLDVDYLGPENGAWTKDRVPIQMLSDPR